MRIPVQFISINSQEVGYFVDLDIANPVEDQRLDTNDRRAVSVKINRTENAEVELFGIERQYVAGVLRKQGIKSDQGDWNDALDALRMSFGLSIDMAFAERTVLTARHDMVIADSGHSTHANAQEDILWPLSLDKTRQRRIRFDEHASASSFIEKVGVVGAYRMPRTDINIGRSLDAESLYCRCYNEVFSCFGVTDLPEKKALQVTDIGTHPQIFPDIHCESITGVY